MLTHDMASDRVRELILRRINELGLKETSLSLQIGRNWAYLNQFLKRGVPANLPEGVREKLAPLLDLNPNDMRLQEYEYKKSRGILHQRAESSLTVAQPHARTTNHFGPDTIPLLGHANGSSDAILISTENEIGRVLRHPNQHGLKDAFALTVVGDSMAPRYYDGEVAYIGGKTGPKKGQDCIIELLNSEGYLKEFVRRNDKEIICRQLNPPKEWKKKLSEVKSVHAVVGRG